MKKFEVTAWKRVLAWAEIPVEAKSEEHAKDLVAQYLAAGEPELGLINDSTDRVDEGEYEGLGSFSWEFSDEGIDDIEVHEVVNKNDGHITP